MELQQNFNLIIKFESELLDDNTFAGKILSFISNGSNKPIFQIFGDTTILH